MAVVDHHSADGSPPERVDQPTDRPSDQPALGTPAHREFERGLEAQRNNQVEEAIKAYVRAIEIDPRHGQALNNLGVALRARGFYHAALAAYDRALSLSPDDPGLLGNRGNVLRALGRYQEALVTLYAAVKRAPEVAGLQQNLGLVLRDLGHLREAIGCFERSLELRPDHQGTRKDKAVALLAEGNYLKGFKELKASAETPESRTRFAHIPEWRGGSFSGQTVLVHSAQDLVNCVQFARFLPGVKARGGRVLLECPKAIHGLMASVEGLDELLDVGCETWGIDQQISLLSLPSLLGTTRRSIPAAVPYLSAPRQAGFELRHPESARLTVGVAWRDLGVAQPNPVHALGLEPFFKLFGHSGVAYYSLQRGPAAVELQQLGAAGLVHNLSNLLTNLEDIARVIEQLDLVIAADSLVAHIAGALAKPVWVALPVVSDWRWVLDRDRSSWYPTMRLFRQKQRRDWDTPFAAVAEALQGAKPGQI